MNLVNLSSRASRQCPWEESLAVRPRLMPDTRQLGESSEVGGAGREEKWLLQ